jgi:hypothetical protein
MLRPHDQLERIRLLLIAGGRHSRTDKLTPCGARPSS